MIKAKNSAALIAILCFSALFAEKLYCEVIDKISVVVNDEIITEGEIARVLIPIYEQYKERYQGDELFKKLEEARQKVVEQLIEDRILLSEAKRVSIEIGDNDIEARMSDAASRFPSREEFDRALAAQGLTIKDLRVRYREQLMIRRLIDQKIGSKVAITPIDINNYYNAHTGDFFQPERIKLGNILIRDEDDPKKALETANDILEKLKAGSDFAEMARTYSQGQGALEGGTIGYVKNDELMPEIQHAIAGLKEGEISGIVRTSLGYHIFKVEEKSRAGTLSVSEARRTIEEAIFKEKINKKIREFIQGLKKNAYIAFK